MPIVIILTLLGVFSLSAKKSSSDMRSSGILLGSVFGTPTVYWGCSAPCRSLTVPTPGRVKGLPFLRWRRKGLPSNVAARGMNPPTL